MAKAGSSSNVMPARGPRPAIWLHAALEELDQVEKEAAEEGYPEPSAAAKGHARRILDSLSLAALPAPSVYPTEDGEVAIMFRKEGRRAAVVVLCDSSGGAICLSSIAGENRRARYDRATAVPDAFLKAELRRMKSA